jgi:choline dehydrogenase-like flavoprotein
MDVAVVGSGFSGLSAAHALTARGVAVTVFDVGEMLDEVRSAAVARLHELEPTEWPREDFRLISENATFGTAALPRKMHFGSDYIYAADRSFAPVESRTGGRLPYPTFARGGFSNIWGAAVLPPDQCDMADWPVSRAEMEPFFRAAAQLIPLAGGEGTLDAAFPSYKEALGELDPSPQGQALLRDLRRAGPRLSAAQLLYGKARLAVHTAAAPGGVLACNGCGHCFTGCVRGSIFSTLPLLEAMVRQRRIAYRPGLFVETVEEAADKVLVEAAEPRSASRHRLAFDAVFLAAGAVSTTRLLLHSRRLYNRPILLKDSQKFLMPMLRRQATPTTLEQPSVTLASVFLETKVPSIGDHWVHVQVVPVNRMILDGLPLPGARHALGRRLWTPLLRRLMIAWCSLHSDHSPPLELCLRRDGDGAIPVLEINLRPTDASRATVRAVANELARKGRLFGTLFTPWIIKLSDSGTHAGGSFPMRARPRELMDSDRFGRPFGWSRVFGVDATVLPSIPGTTLVFPMMANAYRIGALAPLG